MFKFFEQLKTKSIEWCIDPIETTIGELHGSNVPYTCEIYNDDDLKFIEQTAPSTTLVKTPTGFSPIKHSHKTVAYDVYELILANGMKLRCADNHIVINDQGHEIFVKDLHAYRDLIQTRTGSHFVTSIAKINVPPENMFDLELDDLHHVYYTNGVVSHNSITSAVFLLWFAMFSPSKTVLIAAHKNDHAMEMVERIQYAYEFLPMFLKPGVTDDGWNKHSIKFDNKSRILSTATSGSSGRGLSISLLYLDEFAFVAPNIQEEFWTSILPTLSTGGACIMTSTPNGSVDKFASIWRAANIDNTTSGMMFEPMHVAWDQPPGRGEEFKKDNIALLGELKWKQEYECQFLSSDPLLIDSLVLNMLEDATEEPIYEDMGFKFYQKLNGNATYILGMDPATGTGEDFTTMLLYNFHDMSLVCEYRSNTVSSPSAYATLKWLLIKIEQMQSTTYFSIENNGVGEGIIALYENDETIPMTAEFLSEEGAKRLGMRTESKVKLRTCLTLKQMVESGTLGCKSSTMVKELKSFISTRGSYSAQIGATDDLISSCLIVIRVLQEMATYEQRAFDIVNKYETITSEDSSGFAEEWDDNYVPDGMVI